MSNRRSHLVHRLQTLPSALAGVSVPRKLLALAAVLALLALALQPPAAQAQTVTDVWSATLDPGLFGTGYGCNNAGTSKCSLTNILSDDSFSYVGTTYSFTEIILGRDGVLKVVLDSTPSAATIFDLTLNVDDSPFPLSSASLSGSTLTWAESGLTWTLTTDVMLTLTATTYAPDDVVVVPRDWPLIPSGVEEGQQFRLLFLTSTFRQPSSTDIDVYNRFVQNRAAAGHEDIREYRSGFRVVGSTASVDARDNTVTTYTQGNRGVPIYWLTGAKAADNYADFYDGSWDSEEPRDESGNVQATTFLGDTYHTVPTGSTASGIADQREARPYYLGRTDSTTVGYLNHTVGSPLSSPDSGFPSESFPFYGLSQIFQVEGSAVLLPGELPPLLPGELPEPIDPPPPVVVPSGWELIPDGLGTGSQFRLLFVTSGLYTAESSDIADYNGRVRFNAGRGHGALTAYAGGFRVVGSTASVPAPSNTDTIFSDANPGVPIYWVKGRKVADDYADFYDGTWDEEREGRNAKGEALSRFTRRGLETSGVWTGIRVGHELGTSQVVMGLPNKDPGYVGLSAAGPLSSNAAGDGDPAEGLDFAPLYGLSQVFEVGIPASADLPKVPTKPLNPSVATCYVHSW